jgi:hypothetical protein
MIVSDRTRSIEVVRLTVEDMPGWFTVAISESSMSISSDGIATADLFLLSVILPLYTGVMADNSVLNEGVGWDEGCWSDLARLKIERRDEEIRRNVL